MPRMKSLGEQSLMASRYARYAYAHADAYNPGIAHTDISRKYQHALCGIYADLGDVWEEFAERLDQMEFRMDRIKDEEL